MENFDKTQNICRICLVENNEEIQSVFGTIESTREPLKFSEFLMRFAKIEIISGDELPDQICSTCVQNTVKLYLFKIQCEESDKTLRNRLKEDRFIVIDKIDIDEEDIFDKIKSEIKEENVEVSDVLSTSLEDDSRQEKDLFHGKEIAEQAQKIKMIKQECDSQKHEINKDKNTINGLAMKSLVIILEDCNKMSSLKNSMITRNDKKTLYTSGKSCNDSNIRQHSVGYVTKSSSPAKHKLSDSRKKMYECDICNKKLSSSTALKRHKFTHTGEKPYECDVCKQRFTRSSNLLVHKRKHTGEKPYECDVCKRRFNQKSNLLVHRWTHTGEKPYECDVCKQKFIRSNNLIIHKRTHTGEKPYKCDVCTQRFTRSGDLTIHKRRHTGEKPHVCNVCKHSFTKSGDLTIHQRTHTGEKPYECDVCKQKFRRSNHLIVHKRSH